MPQPQEEQSTHFELAESTPHTMGPEQAIDQVLNVPNGHIEHHRERVQSSVAPVPQFTRLIRDSKGKYMFIGDSANLSFLQNIRRLVEASIGTCAFTEDPLRYMMVEDAPPEQKHWLDFHTSGPVDKPSLPEATRLISQYMLATNCVLDLFDESELLAYLPRWLEGGSEGPEPYSPIYYLILAIGAQTSSDDKDDVAELYFNHGRYLTALLYMEEPSLPSVQSHILIATYMLGGARRNAAFIQLGTAARAAHALGLHKREVSDLFAGAERRTRERTWKVLRVLDSFMSSSLGRPYSTSETRDTTAKDNYSAAANLCAIFEHIETLVYAKRMVSTEVVQQISKEHRYWTARFHEGLKEDGISPEDYLPGGHPNIGLIHLKEAYYWSIILLTRPFLIEYVSIQIENRRMLTARSEQTVGRPSNQTLVDACVDSAVRTVNLLNILHSYRNIPKRLPFIVNSIFIAGMVAGIAFLGDLDRSFPLVKALQDAQAILRLFSLHDTLAKRHLVILEYLQMACDTYVERRDRQKMDGHRRTIGSIFGVIHEHENVSRGMSAAIPDVGTTSSPHVSVAEPPEGFNQPNPPQPHQSGTTAFDPNFQSEQGTSESPWVSEQSQSISLTGAPNDLLLNDFDAYNDQVLEFSPRTLWFDAYEENNPLWRLQGFFESSAATDQSVPQL